MSSINRSSFSRKGFWKGKPPTLTTNVALVEARHLRKMVELRLFFEWSNMETLVSHSTQIQMFSCFEHGRVGLISHQIQWLFVIFKLLKKEKGKDLGLLKLLQRQPLPDASIRTVGKLKKMLNPKRGLPCHHLSFNPLKKWRNPESPTNNTWQYLGLILSMVTVGAEMVDPAKSWRWIVGRWVFSSTGWCLGEKKSGVYQFGTVNIPYIRGFFSASQMVNPKLKTGQIFP